MIRPIFFPKPVKTNYEYQEGESIETKVKRITENNEPITDGAPIIYTNREDGVLPAYSIELDDSYFDIGVNRIKEHIESNNMSVDLTVKN